MVKSNKLLCFLTLFVLLTFADSFQKNSFSTLRKSSNNNGVHLWTPKPTFVQRSVVSVSANIITSRGSPLKLIGGASFALNKNSYFLTRIVFLRALAFVYGVAFLVAKHQNKALIGDNGITPARKILNLAQERGRSKRKRREAWMNSAVADKPVVADNGRKNPLVKLRNHELVRTVGTRINRDPRYQLWRERLWDRQDGMGRPVTTLLWLAKDRTKLNPWLDSIANWGIGMSLAVFFLGSANLPIMLGLWSCQRSLMAVGGPWYGYGWEPQLAELGFHAMFLVPLLSLDPLCATSPPSRLVIYAIRWYLFRIMIGAGLIKIRSGDIKWKWPELSAMKHFYETQPVPNPWTRYFHWFPARWHQAEVLMNHFVELVAPWLLLAPVCNLRRLGGAIQIVFQAILISSGNLSFLNWLTAVPAITCLDDAFLGRLFSSSWKKMVADVAYGSRSSWTRQLVSVAFGLLVATLSIPVVKNLLSRQQSMNASFDPLRLVNSYGAFGSVDEVRDEFIVSAASDLEGPWKEYHFKVKPGDLKRRPRFISPYHYRLDWQMWLASTLQNLDRSPWVYPFLLKLLEQDPEVLSLLESDPFENEKDGPKYIRIEKYRYEFHKPKRLSDKNEQYWTRELVGRVFPRQGVVSMATLQDYVGKD